MRAMNLGMLSILVWGVGSLGIASADGFPIRESFETGDATPEGWKRGARIPGVEYVFDKKQGSEGKRSLSLQKSANRYFPIAQWFKTFDHDSEQSSLNLKAMVKAAKATKAIIDVQFMDGSGGGLGHEWVAYIGQQDNSDRPASHSWKPYEGKADIPAGTKQIMVAFQIYGPGKVWLDELEIRYGGQAGDSKKPSTVATSAPVSPKAKSLQLPSGSWTRYVLIPPAKSAAKPAGGYPVLMVLPGGDGSIDFHGFTRSMHEKAMDGRYVIVQMIAPPAIVWPTKQSKARYATTEESIRGIAKHLAEKYPIDSNKLYALAWSSGGPALYASLLGQDSPLSGGFIAMSVFRAGDFTSLDAARGKKIHLLHSPEDRVCPYRMAEDAFRRLKAAGAEVQLVDYDGGHGWHGPVFDNIRSGMDWLSGG